jgi:hypothetical protein
MNGPTCLRPDRYAHSITPMFGMSKSSGPAPKKAAKPKPQAQPMVAVRIELSAQQRDKLQRLGGAAWVRDAIDKAKLPSE